ncbi:unnamed protein product [Cylindrotheca closterium]|uniref:OTU domain-containing protein n=1 Tax=Cylindrotheca closterium TaxID=2856 RepID=A0AAD2CHE2_9STRA|nr:unnamed protein product [Cylindrotheca closterium]
MPILSLPSSTTILFLIFRVSDFTTFSFTSPVLRDGREARRTLTNLKSTNGLDVDASATFINVFTTVETNDEIGDSSGSSASIKKMLSTFEYAPNGVCVDPELFVLKDSDKTEQGDGIKKCFTMRNVPGNGDCMFLAVALAAATSMGLGGNDALLEAISKETREVVAQVLSSPNGNLHIANGQTCKAQALLQQATRGEGLGDDTDRYLELLRKPGAKGGIQGGGPELTVLANVLRRPISIYELAPPVDDIGEKDRLDSSPSTYPIVCKGTFGLDLFADPCATIPESAVLSNVQPGAYSWQLHILILDVSPNGNEKHACVLLPQTPI